MYLLFVFIKLQRAVQQNSETSGKDDEKSVQNSHKSNKSEELENATEKDDAKSKVLL